MEATSPIYLDANATAPPLPEVEAAVREALATAWANPSSLHGPGRAARAALERARAEVAALFGVSPDEVVLTGGAGEANAIALDWALAAAGSGASDDAGAGRGDGGGASRSERHAPPRIPAPPRIIASAVEHPTLRDRLLEAAARGCARVRWLAVDGLGRVDLEAARAALAEGPAALLSVQWANSETGVIQPVAALGALARSAGVAFHVDAAQAAGRVPIDLGGGGGSGGGGAAAAAPVVDLLSVSARKLHGPGGAGALVVRRGTAPPLRTPPTGPSQRAWRPFTEDVAGAAGFGTAARLAREALAGGALDAVADLRDRLEAGLFALGAVPHGAAGAALGEGAARRGGAALRDGAAGPPRLPNTTSVRFPGLDGATLVLELAKRGIAASTGSACMSAALEPSHVLLAMGIGAREARGALRLSLSRLSRPEEIDRCLAVLGQLVPRLRKLG